MSFEYFAILEAYEVYFPYLWGHMCVFSLEDTWRHLFLCFCFSFWFLCHFILVYSHNLCLVELGTCFIFFFLYGM